MIVITSLISVYGPNSATFKLFRLARVFRIMRLLRTFESLKKLAAALRAAVPGVLHAFLIVFFVCCFYSIVATTFFRLRLPEYFGYFGLSMFTFWMMLTFDNACGTSAMLFQQYSNRAEEGLVALFFIVFQAGAAAPEHVSLSTS